MSSTFMPSLDSTHGPTAPPLDLMPPHIPDAVGTFQQQNSGGAPRHKLVLHAYTLLLVLFLLTFTLVATSKVLQVSITAPINNVPWLIFYVVVFGGSVVGLTASLMAMIMCNLAIGESVLNELLLLMLWGGTTLNLILITQPFTMLVISFVACVFLLLVIILTFCAVQTKYDITKNFCVVLGLLALVATCVVVLAVCCGEHVAKVAIQVVWIATAVVVVLVLAHILVDDMGQRLLGDNFLLSSFIFIFTLSLMGLFFSTCWCSLLQIMCIAARIFTL